MVKQNAIRRRGKAILAAVFFLAMVGTFAPAVMPGSPLIPAANAQDPAPGVGGDQAIYSPGKASEKGTISGSVKEIVKAAAGDMTTKPGVKKRKLPRTGAQGAGLVGIAAAMGVAGLGLALV